MSRIELTSTRRFEWPRIRLIAFSALILFVGFTRAGLAQSAWHAAHRFTWRTDVPLRADADVVEHGGNLYTSSNGTALTILHANGTVTTIGRAGRGPGEFTMIKPFGFLHDTLWVVDRAANQITYFDPSGHVIRTEPGRAYFMTDHTVLPVIRVIDGDRIVSSVERSTTSEKLRRVAWVHVSTGREGPPYKVTITDTLGVYSPGTGDFAIKTPDGFIALVPQLFDDGDLSALSPDGGFMVTVTRRVTIVQNASYILSGRFASGKTFSVAIPCSARKIAKADIDRYFARIDREDSLSARMSSMRSARFAFESQLYKPKWAPLVTNVMIGSDNTIWVQRTGNGTTASWDVFDANGKQLGYVDLPERLMVKAVSRAAVWGLEEDEDGSPIMTRYAVGPR